ncbi:ABC transporter ATP-binding protein [Brenneria goodwinii]|uniref:ABC transporter ATP-binding protein n=1 Tax=Brenneria goodwinii TaxID=1109412 RepID=UPI000EF28BDB|nr:ABC transporter ATP-binding protein [Brenneria goodwinii]MCG8157159.1 ABC transporter ATP-binding protein [Brenneria goodwinii]MCG8160101.1 ABC transporter ATP-binding protein [Brenneria goodwinii]MCG8164624.1 ABC transporter ATP-binding protein [Brenneria goodwinii]MCG8170670.1 ABC transporter ATP-binding protein [Brenneria goodwinii]MCG8174198.1 ABC transporter ATP-binding protein [Brenneria goodwinii]
MINPPDILTIEHVTCRYQQNNVLSNFSLSAREREIVCLLGASGCGKTTLLNAVAGLIPIAEGTIAVSGEIIGNGQVQVAPELRQVGMIFQDDALFPHLTVAQNIAFGLYDRPQDAIATVVSEMMALVKLEGLDARYPHELSGEQQQRVAIARALACKPKILLLDEPFSNIDNQVRYHLITELRLILKQLQVVTIFVTHDRDEAFAFADRLAVMDNGGIVQDGYPATLYQRPNSRFIADYLGSSNYLPVTILSDHQWHSIFGDHTATHVHGQPIGSSCDWLVRPHDIALALDPDGVAEIEDRVFMGTLNHYRIRLDEQMIQVQSSIWFEPGQRVRLSIKNEQPILFPGS